MQKNKNICLMGAALDTGNMGVSALSASFIGLVKKRLPDAEINLLIGHRSAADQNLFLFGKEETIHIVNYRLSPKSRLSEHLLWILFLAILYRMIPITVIRQKIIQSNRWLRTVKNADFIGSIHGGDSFSDIYGIRRFIVNIFPDMIVFLLKQKLYLLPQTYGPYNSKMAEYIASRIISSSEYILSRDQEGIDILKDVIDVKSLSRVLFCPDVAFSLEAQLPEKSAIDPPLVKKENDILVGLNVNGLMYHGGYSKKNMFGLKSDYRKVVLKIAIILLENTQIKLLLIPHTFAFPGDVNSDPDACQELLDNLPSDKKNRVFLVTEKYNQNEIKGIIGLCDFFIGSRMHACIAALSQAVPTIGIAYSRKFRGVFDSLGMNDTVIDAREQTESEILEKLNLIFSNRHQITQELEANVQKVKLLLAETFDRLLFEISN